MAFLTEPYTNLKLLMGLYILFVSRILKFLYGAFMIIHGQDFLGL